MCVVYLAGQRGLREMVCLPRQRGNLDNYHYLKQWTEYQVHNINIGNFETVHTHTLLGWPSGRVGPRF